ncbi:MAG: phage portal protein [Propionibacteriaceae bacterium]|nr:phage portal protein [Propionibacteriaceae bacterium]
MALSPTEVQIIDRLRQRLDAGFLTDEKHLRYYQGRQRVEQLGMAIPAQMRRFLVIANWCRTVVDTTNDRQQVRALVLPGEETADPLLREIWDANNLSAHFSMFNTDRQIYGRAFMSVGANEDNPDHPIVRVESPREMVAEVDVRRERITAAARFYGTDANGIGPQHVTLYLPDVTVWVDRTPTGRWVEVERDEHRLGAVPIVMHLNRRMSGGWVGESQLADVIPFADAAARSLTNMQFAQEAHGAPRMWMTAVSQGDFLDQSGKPIPKLEAYFNAVTTLTNKDAKVGQLTAADLKNFETAMSVYGTQASVVTGFPARYFGITHQQPPTEGTVVADEISLVRSVEAQNLQLGMTIGWAGALAYRFSTGEWVEGNRVRTEWHNPATPTVAQREDALMKRRSQGVLSRRGYMVELGWSEARIAQELQWLDEESSGSPDPYLIAEANGRRADSAVLG